MIAFRVTVAAVLASLHAAGLAAAEDAPVAGRVYNFTLNERIHYDCGPKVDGILRCRFTSATVGPLLREDEFATRRAEELSRLTAPEATDEFREIACDAAGRMEADLADGTPDEVQGVLPEDAERLLQTFRTGCETPDQASLEAFIDFGLDIERRTCTISTFSWEGNFRRTDEKTWVRIDSDGPVGDGCGGVHLDRFELAEEGFLWNLVRRSIASNPNGTFTTGEQCSEIYPRDEITYRWQGGDLPGRCDYIRLNLSN